MRKSINLFLCLLFTICALFTFNLTTFATGENTSDKTHMLTIICKTQDESIVLTDYDEVNVRVLHKNSGHIYEFVLYGYNQFLDKYVVPEGDYLITEVYIKDKKDLVLEVPNIDFPVENNTAITIPLIDSGIVSAEGQTISETTTYYNPFDETSPSDKPTSPNEQTQSSENTSEVFTEVFTESFSDELITEQTTNEEDPSKDSNISSIIILLIIIAIVFLCAILFVAIRKRNKE